MKKFDKLVLITGASSGIGEACAEVFAEAGARLLLFARRKERLDEIAHKLRKEYGTDSLTISGDVRSRQEVENIINGLEAAWKDVDVLINNAGLARGLDKIQEGQLRDWEEMIDTNIKGLLYMSRLILPGMVSRGNGMVINIGSVAGHEVYPAGNVYCATKHAVRALTKGMAIDLNGTGVRAASIDPGLVETEFSDVRFHGDTERARGVYRGYTPLTGRDIAEIALFIASRPPHVMIQDVLVTPTDQANAYILNKSSEPAV